MNYKVENIAKHIISYSIDNLNPVSNLKLQKLLYYVQAAFLVEKDKPAFDAPIMAWKYGPVVEDIYYEYRNYVNADILTSEDIDEVFAEEDECLINKVVDSYKKYSGVALIQKTHRENPWKKFYEKDNIYDAKEIDQKTIRNYYAENKASIYGVGQ